MPKPLLIVSDAVTAPSGLGREARELAIRIHENLSDVFRLGTLGYGGNVSRKYPWTQYTITALNNWVIPELPSVWQDFAGDEKGIIFCIWNASWLPWMADPDSLPDGDLKSFLKSGLFEKWIYAPVDSEGPNGVLSFAEKKILSSFDRVLAYTEWGAGIIDRTLQGPSPERPAGPRTPFLPHGTDGSIFFPRDRGEARRTFVERIVKRGRGRLSDDVVLLGVCATNTPRKDWGLAFQVCRELLGLGVNVGLWAHTDRFQKANAWDLLYLADSAGMTQRVMFTNSHLSDEDMSWGYAAMDATLGIGSGEGWGLPISESLACGVPCITGEYAGATEFTPSGLMVKPIGFRLDGYFANKRPVFHVSDWTDKVMAAITPRRGGSLLRPEFYWKNCWPNWEKWIREGVK